MLVRNSNVQFLSAGKAHSSNRPNQAAGPKPSADMGTVFQPGDLVRRFATLHGWPVAERTILVEGEHDQRYFALADNLYACKTNLRLLGRRLAAFPTGLGGDGGAFGLQRNFHPLRSNMDCDLTSEGRKVFHAIALFDNDLEGKRGFAALTGQHLNYRKWRDVFLLQRVIPRSTRDCDQIAKLVNAANATWQDMDCEIEDLVSVDLINAFLQENPGAVTRDPERHNNGIHCSFQRHAKGPFIRFVEAHALLPDVEQIVELLKSLRYHVALPPDGEPAPTPTNSGIL
jgi:hypothetical protein